MFQNKTLLITGGTGSFGNAVLHRFLGTKIAEIRVFSRDEKKQDDMRHQYRSEKLRFYIGDVQNPDGLRDDMEGVDYVFHAAALKQVFSCEFYPSETVFQAVLASLDGKPCLPVPWCETTDAREPIYPRTETESRAA